METSAITVVISINGVDVPAPQGASVAAILLASGIATRTAADGGPRAALCGMGICMECRATVDGVAHVRTCQIAVRSGMRVVTG